MKNLHFTKSPRPIEQICVPLGSGGFNDPDRHQTAARWARVIPALFLLVTLTATAQAEDYTYTTNSGAITITGYTGSDAAVVIPDTINGLPVTAIGDHAFWVGGQGISSVEIPDSVTLIEASAFTCCSSLAHVSMGHAVASIESSAFYYCTNLNYITIPASVTNIGSGAFQFCDSLKKVYFRGDAPNAVNIFDNTPTLFLHYRPDTAGWGSTFCGRPAYPWDPQILTDDGSFGVGTNGFGFTIEGFWMGTFYNYHTVVKACTNLSTGEWFPLITNEPPATHTIYFSDPQWTNYPVRFYGLDMP